MHETECISMMLF